MSKYFDFSGDTINGNYPMISLNTFNFRQSTGGRIDDNYVVFLDRDTLYYRDNTVLGQKVLRVVTAEGGDTEQTEQTGGGA